MSESLLHVVTTSVVAQRQIREVAENAELRGLAQSIKEQGVLQPLLVRREGDAFVLVDGERRLRAAKLAGLKTVPVIVETTPLKDSDVLQRQLVANIQRADLSPMEKARAIQRLLDEASWSAADTAAKLGLSAASVSRLLALLTLPPSVQAQVESGEVPASTAYEIARAGGGAAEQERLASEVAAGGLSRDSVAGRIRRKAATPADGDAPSAAARVTVKLPGGRAVTLAGNGLSSLERLIDWLEELLSRARKARPTGVTLATFARVLRDEAKAEPRP